MDVWVYTTPKLGVLPRISSFHTDNPTFHTRIVYVGSTYKPQPQSAHALSPNHCSVSASRLHLAQVLDCRLKYAVKMRTSLISLVFAVTFALQSVPAASQFDNSSIPIAYEAKFIEKSTGICPTAEESQEAQDEIRLDVRRLLGLSYTCGGSGWDRIAYLNMSDSSHQCPGDFREATFDGMRLCAHDSTADTSLQVCTSTIFSSNGIPSSAVCGRVVGYQYGTTVGFINNTISGPRRIDEYYADGVTHGPVGAREHIWTFATGLQEDALNLIHVCPCARDASPTIMVPPFIGDDYFCESGTLGKQGGGVFHDDPLWAGDGCPEGNSCCTFNNPPYFTRQLPVSTSDDIELRDCGLYRGIGSTTRADTLIQFIELFTLVCGTVQFIASWISVILLAIFALL